MEKLELKVGQPIQIDTDSVVNKNTYESELLSVSHKFLEISTPHKNGTFIPLNTGFNLNVKTNTPHGLVEFTTKVIGKDANKQSLFVSVPQDIIKAIEVKNHTENQKNCKFVTITSGKGGTGKTSFVINYAIALSKRGKKVAIIDADLGMANVDILLKIVSSYSLTDIIKGSKTIEEVIVDAPGRIKLIPGGSGLQELASVTPYQFERLLSGFEYLEKNFDYVLIDTSAGLSKNISEFVHASSETIIITTPEPHAISDAFSILKILITQNNSLNLKLVVNKCETPEEGETVVNRIAGVVKNVSTCSFTSLGCIPESRIVTKAIKEQNPFCLSYPDSDVAQSVEAIVDSELGMKKRKVSFNVPAQPVPIAEPLPSMNNNNIPNVPSFVNKFKGLFGKNL